MKVLLTHRPGGAYAYISDAWKNALNDTGHTAMRWDGTEGQWRDFKPDLYIGCSGHKQQMPTSRGDALAIFHTNPFCDTNLTTSESQSDIDWVVRQKPNAVIGYGFDDHGYLWSNWTKRHGLKWIPCPNAGDKTIYGLNTVDKTINMSYIGGFWPYKGTEIRKYVLPLRNHGLQIWGWGEWPGGSNGVPNDDEVIDILLKSKLVPCVSEPHTKLNGTDIPERPFKAALSGAVVVHDDVPFLRSAVPSFIVAGNPDDFVTAAISNIENRELATKQRDQVLNSHTYHHRMARVLNDLGISKSEMLGLADYIK